MRPNVALTGPRDHASSDKAAMAARIKALADEYADAQVRLEAAQSVLSIQVGSHRVEQLEAELHAAIDALARA